MDGLAIPAEMGQDIRDAHSLYLPSRKAISWRYLIYQHKPFKDSPMQMDSHHEGVTVNSLDGVV